MDQWKIFLSFRGDDTRYGFTGFLFDALCGGGFNTFMDDGGGLQNGDEISSSLSDAIKASRLSIVILSENYASSPWCLDELATILECKQSKNQLVWPIFYKVQPSNIRKLENNYGKWMTEHEQRLGSHSETLQKWRSALFEVSGLSGQTYKIGSNYYEYKFIQEIVTNVRTFVQVDVEKEKNILVSNRDLVRVKYEATNHETKMVSSLSFYKQTKKDSDVMCEWLNDTDKLIQEVENMMEQAKPQHVEQDEFRKLLQKVKAQNMTYELIYPISTRIPSLEHFSYGNIVSFNSREKASDQLFVALKDDNCSMIRLYGRQGSGKTALVNAMSEKVKYVDMFGVVLFLNVTKNQNIRTMQDVIADMLNVKFDNIIRTMPDEAGRAKIILSTIESMECPILVIFDDVGAKFDPEEVGIPRNSNRCKILLTTCCKHESDLMNRQMDIQLDPLSKDESWTLFIKYSGIDHESSFDLMNVAREVAFECEGLPRTIKDVGSSLRSKPIEEWKITLDSLKHSMAKWQIFLSFSGKDTRYSFTRFLYQALSQGGFKTFMDDEELQTGDQISLSLLNAIEESRLSIIVLSENYANSSWCLDELVKVMECMKLKDQIVWPIFFNVDPSDIRRLRNSYGKAMAQHEHTFGVNSERVQKWKSALTEVANLFGWIYTTGSYETEFIEKIVKDVNDFKNRLQIRSI